MSNHQNYQVYSAGSEIEDYADILMKSEGKTLQTIRETLLTHDGIGSYLYFNLRKFMSIWNGYEAPNNVNIYYYQKHAPILQFLFINFYWIAPLGIIGFFLALSQHWRDFWKPLYAFVFMQLALLTFFFALARLRIPLQVVLLPFAAYVLVYIFQYRNKKAILAIIGVIILAFAIGYHSSDAHIRHADYVTPYRVYYAPAIQEATEKQDWEKAFKLNSNYLQFQPPNIAILEGTESVEDLKINKQTAAFYHSIYENHAYLCRKTNQLVEAEVWKSKALLLRELSN